MNNPGTPSSTEGPQEAHSKLSPSRAGYASFGARFLGLLIDAFLFALVLVLVPLALLWSTLSDPDTSPTVAGVILLVWVLVVWMTQGAYYVVGLHRYGMTVGGWVAETRCVDSEGRFPSWSASLIREGVVFGFGLLTRVPVVGLFAIPVFLLNYLWMLWDKDKQCWMDKAAKTYVVRAPYRDPWSREAKIANTIRGIVLGIFVPIGALLLGILFLAGLVGLGKGL